MPKSGATLTTLSNYEKRIVRALRRLTQKLDAHSRHLLIGYDVTMPQILCLDELNEKGVMTVTVLANAIELKPSTTVGIIDRLEKKGFVGRKRDTVDRRAVFVEITDKGREFIIKTPHLLHNRLHGKLRKLAKDEKIQIANSLELLLLFMDYKSQETATGV
jgi:DNA-binding MarR family transcriptional regulator